MTLCNRTAFLVLISLCLLAIPCGVFGNQQSPKTEQIVVQSSPDLADPRLEHIQEFKVAQGFFSDILQSQLWIFSTIFVAFLALTWLYNWRVSSSLISERVGRAESIVKEKLELEQKKFQDSLRREFDDKFKQQKYILTGLRGELARAMALISINQQFYAGGFIWWLRAAKYYSEANEESLSRTALSSAKASVEKCVAHDVNDHLGEYQEIVSQIPEGKYRIEKEILDRAFRGVLEKKPS